MLTFKQYMICESATERKIQKGFSDPPVQIAGAEVVHHDPASETTVYHIKHPKGAYTLGSKTDWCTATPRRSFAYEYLSRGNLFTILKGNRRFNYSVEHTHPYDEEFRDQTNKRADVSEVIPDHVASNIKDIPHHRFDEEWQHPLSTMPEKAAIKEIRSQEPKDRVTSYNSMIHGIDRHPEQRVQANDRIHERETAVAGRFTANDLHHFSDDPHLPAARLIASHGDLDKVVHKMKDHPDPEVQRIIKDRVSRAGGEKALIPQRPEPEPISNDPNQFKLKFPTVKKKA